MTPSVRDTLALLDAFAPDDAPRAMRGLERTRRLLRDSPAPFDRARYDPGHVTASALVLSPDATEVLLVYHRRLARWLQPGGHVEPRDATVLAAARREVTEETGVPLDGSPPALVAVDVHAIPPARGEPRHLHHDLVFRMQAAAPALTAGAAQARWVPLDRVEQFGADEALLSALRRARGAVTRGGP